MYGIAVNNVELYLHIFKREKKNRVGVLRTTEKETKYNIVCVVVVRGREKKNVCDKLGSRWRKWNKKILKRKQCSKSQAIALKYRVFQSFRSVNGVRDFRWSDWWRAMSKVYSCHAFMLASDGCCLPKKSVLTAVKIEWHRNTASCFRRSSANDAIWVICSDRFWISTPVDDRIQLSQ